MAIDLRCQKCGKACYADDDATLEDAACPYCESADLHPLKNDATNLRWTGSIVGGAMLGASLLGVMGAILGLIVGLLLASSGIGRAKGGQ